MPRGPSEILLYLICRKFLLSVEPYVKNEVEMVMLPVIGGVYCVPCHCSASLCPISYLHSILRCCCSGETLPGYEHVTAI